MAEVTVQVQTQLPGWDYQEVVTVERTEFVDALIDSGRLTVLPEREPAPEPAPRRSRAKTTRGD